MRDVLRRDVALQIDRAFGNLQPRQHGKLANVGVGAIDAEEGNAFGSQELLNHRSVGSGDEHRHVDLAPLQRIGRLHPGQRNELGARFIEPEIPQQHFHHLACAAAGRAGGDLLRSQRIQASEGLRATVKEPERLVRHGAERHEPGLVTRPRQSALHQRDRDAASTVAQPLQVLGGARRLLQHQLNARSCKDLAVALGEGIVGAALGARAR